MHSRVCGVGLTYLFEAVPELPKVLRHFLLICRRTRRQRGQE